MKARGNINVRVADSATAQLAGAPNTVGAERAERDQRDVGMPRAPIVPLARRIKRADYMLATARMNSWAGLSAFRPLAAALHCEGGDAAEILPCFSPGGAVHRPGGDVRGLRCHAPDSSQSSGAATNDLRHGSSPTPSRLYRRRETPPPVAAGTARCTS
jgi:hypothetical protein